MVAIIAIIAVIAAAAAVYGIIAYFTAKDSKTNTFVVGNVSIRLDEGEAWAQIQANGGNLNLEPNQEITKEPKIINTGRNSAYVYLKVRIPKAKINANDTVKRDLFTYVQNTTDWDILEEDDQADYVERTYWYKGGNGILNAGAETGTIFDYVKLANLTWSPEGLGEIKINVNAYAIQADNLSLTGSTAKAKAEEAYQKYLDQEDDLNSATVTFLDEDGQTVLGTSKVKLGTNASYTGSTPTKAGTQQYTYTFSGWDDPSKLNNVTENRSVRAVYTTATNKYVVTFYDENGTTQLGTSEVDYGTNASFTGSTPEKAADSSYTYTFDNWYTSLDANATVDDLSNVIANRSVYAKYTQTEIPASAPEIGSTVNYSTTLNNVTLDNWKVFYNDEENGYTYLIYGDYLPNSAISNDLRTTYNLANGNGSYTIKSTNNRAELINALSNKASYDSLLTGTLTVNGETKQINETRTANVWAMGAPTLELWVNSWNTSYPSDTLYTNTRTGMSGEYNYGYYIGTDNAQTTSTYVDLSSKTGYSNTLYYPHTSSYGNCNAYWLASPSALRNSVVMDVNCGGFVRDASYGNRLAARPVVCLPTNILQ